MLDYQTTQTCRMEFLARTLDDPTAAPCGRCDVCAGPWFPTGWDGAARERADQALRRTGVPIEPRRMWPSNMDHLGVPVKGRIAEGEQAEEGRALARLTDLGWGSRLRELLAAEDAPLPEEVLQGAVAVLAAWGWQARPIAVVAMPSRGRPQLVDSFARGIARLGRLPFLGALEMVGGGPTAGPGGNSAYRLASVHGRFAVPEAMEHMLRTAPEAGQHGPVLLMDDLVDSRWSLAEAARVLRGAGAQGVLPFVLAQNG